MRRRGISSRPPPTDETEGHASTGDSLRRRRALPHGSRSRSPAAARAHLRARAAARPRVPARARRLQAPHARARGRARSPPTSSASTPRAACSSQGEVAAARASLAGIFERMRKGDCEPLLDLHEAADRAAIATLESFVRRFVRRPGYALDENVTLMLDPDERGYPTTAEERDALQRSLVHFQMSNYLSAGESRSRRRKQAPRAPLRAAHAAARASSSPTRCSRASSTRSRSPSTRTRTTSRPTCSRTSASRCRSRSRASASRCRSATATRWSSASSRAAPRTASTKGGLAARGQDHRGRRGGRRAGRHHRHAAARRGQPDPRQEGHARAAHRAARGREDASASRSRSSATRSISPSRPRSCASRRASATARRYKLAIVELLVVLRRLGSLAPRSAPTTSRSCSSR